MTIAIALKVGDCVVFGADSASTIAGPDGILNVYFNAEKIFNLRKGLPIGAVTWGVGGFESRSITTLAKDLRERFTDPTDEWFLKPKGYTMQQVAERTRQFFFEGLYKSQFPQPIAQKDDKGNPIKIWPAMGFMVGGYSAGEREARVLIIEVDSASGHCNINELFGIGKFGLEAKGQPEAIYRLVAGWSPRIHQGLVESGIPAADAEQFLTTRGAVQLVHPAMPLQDAIDLVRYLADTTAGFMQFIPGAPTVHPPIDVASVSYHELFRWVKRKHYYSPDLNPPAPVVYEPPLP